MRILSVIGSLAEAGGAETLLRNLCLEFAGRGHQCHVAYVSDADALTASPDHEAAVQRTLRDAGISYELIGHQYRRNPLAGALKLRRITRRFRPDVLHSHLGYGLLFASLGRPRVPVVYTHHNTQMRFPPALFRLFDTVVSRYVAICGPCHQVLDRYVRRPIVSIPNGVPARFADAVPRRSLPRDVDILSVGNLRPPKDYGNLITAAALLIPRFERAGRMIRFRIAGEGGDRPALEQAIREHGLTGHVELLGTRSDIAELMAASDLLVLCSREEALPLTLIEGSMAGLPIVATDVGGCSEIVADGRSGLLVPAERPDELARAIEEALSDESRYCAFSVEAQARAAPFTLSGCADAYLDLYRTLAHVPA